MANSAFDDVSDPVNATPSHPINEAKNTYRKPVEAKASPSVKVMPE